MIGTLWEGVAVLLAGMWAGTINTVVGSGTLVSFPILLWVGLPPVTANVSNTLGLISGSATGAWGYRRELKGQATLLRWLVPATIVGSVTGAMLLLVLPAAAFEFLVPILIGAGVVLVILGPRIQQRFQVSRPITGQLRPAWWVTLTVGAAGVYGGYFGAAQGVILMALFGVGLSGSIQQHNAAKNFVIAASNAVAAMIFIFVAQVDWLVAAILAVGAIWGGLIGAWVGRRLSPVLLRSVIVVIGTIAIVAFVT